MRLPEKFKFFNTLQAFHPDIVLSQSRYVQFHKLNLAEFCTNHEDLDELEKQYINIRLCDWTNIEINQVDLHDVMFITFRMLQVCTASELWKNLPKINNVYPYQMHMLREYLVRLP